MARTKHDEPSGPAAAPRRDLAPGEGEAEREFQASLRPRTFDDYVGQRDLMANLKVFVAAARRRREPLDHILFAGPPGLGKTTLAHVIAHELDAKLTITSGPATERRNQVATLLSDLREGDVLFIDEIHRLSPAIEENLYPAMEDFRLDVFTGEGATASTLSLNLSRFTLLGATTRMGLVTAPLLNRFGFHAQLGYYDVDDLTAIVRRSAGLLEVGIDAGGAREIARRSRGTPRIANRLLRRVRDFAQVEGSGAIDLALARFGLDRLKVDHAGLDALDRGYLTAIIERFDGGPVGIEALAATLSEERGTLEDVVEPFLLQEGFITRTPRGRTATGRAFQHLGAPPPAAGAGGSSAGGGQGTLF